MHSTEREQIRTQTKFMPVLDSVGGVVRRLTCISVSVMAVSCTEIALLEIDASVFLSAWIVSAAADAFKSTAMSLAGFKICFFVVAVDSTLSDLVSGARGGGVLELQ